MKFTETDFNKWETPVIEQLRKEGKYVYSIHATEGNKPFIKENGFVNRIGYLVTDQPLHVSSDCYLDMEDFYNMDIEEDASIAIPKKDVSKECEKALKEYEAALAEFSKKMKEYEKLRPEIIRLEKKYKMHTDKCKHNMGDITVVLQYITLEALDDDKQGVNYFIRKNGKLLFSTRRVITKRNASLRTILRCIREKECFQKAEAKKAV